MLVHAVAVVTAGEDDDLGGLRAAGFEVGKEIFQLLHAAGGEQNGVAAAGYMVGAFKIVDFHTEFLLKPGDGVLGDLFAVLFENDF